MPKLTRDEGFPATVVRAMYRSLENGDAPTLARYADPGIEWMHPMVARLPFDGPITS